MAIFRLGRSNEKYFFLPFNLFQLSIFAYFFKQPVQSSCCLEAKCFITFIIGDINYAHWLFSYFNKTSKETVAVMNRRFVLDCIILNDTFLIKILT